MVIRGVQNQRWYTEGLTYLYNRGLNDTTIKTFSIMHFDGVKLHGYPETISQPWIKEIRDLLKTPHYKFRFANTIISPILDLHGKYASIMVRHLGNRQPKFDSTPYDKTNIVFGLHETHQNILWKNEVYVVEGLFDFYVLWQSGIHNCITSNGCNLTVPQVSLLARFCNKFNLVFDPDKAGRLNAVTVQKVIERAGVECRIINLKEKLDLDELILKRGVQHFLKL